jgi:CSLREA domain-containing protein
MRISLYNTNDTAPLRDSGGEAGEETMKAANLFSIRAAILIPAVILFLAAGCGPLSSNFTVNSSADSGDSSPGDGTCRTAASATECTLRAALEEANALAGAQTILFNLPAADTVIYPAFALPEIKEEVVIDGTSQPGFDGGKPVVRVDGSHAGAAPPVSGFKITAGVDVTIQGLQIMRFSNPGIENYGNLTLDHLEIAANQSGGIYSFKPSDGIHITLNNSTVFENIGAGVSGTNTHFTMDYVTMDRNTGGGLRVMGGSLDLDHSGAADNTALTEGGGIFLVMAGNPTIRNTTIKGNTSGQNGGGLYWWGLPGTMMVIENCTFDGNYGYDGGGIYIDAGTSHLSASTLINNRAKHNGGGVFLNANGNPTLWIETGTVIGRAGEGNIANSTPASGGLGGGIYSRATVNISNSSVESNTGDGIYNEGGIVRIQDSSVSANTLSGIESFISGTTVDILVLRSKFVKNGLSGIGAINADLSITQGSIRDNASSGIRMNGGTLTMDRSEVVGNHTGGDGGGLALFNLGLTGIENSTISSNTAAASGGGIYFWGLGVGGDLKLYNTTISGNQAGTTGGGFEAASGEVGVNNVTLARNTAAIAGGLHSAATVHVLNTILAENSGGNCGGAVTSFGYNLDDAASCGFAEAGDLAGLPANLGPLADNGGGTFTHALLPGSPALEAGDDASCRPTDQRGVSRPQGLHCDIGAFESETPATATPPSVTPTLTPTGTPAPVSIVFDPVNFSTKQMYTKIGRSCTPKEVTIEVKLTPEKGVQSVGLFYRLEEKSGGNMTPWSIGYSMIPQGGGWYKLTIHSEDFPDLSKLNGELWLAVQFVANGPNDQVLAHSAIYRQVTVGQCMQ